MAEYVSKPWSSRLAGEALVVFEALDQGQNRGAGFVFKRPADPVLRHAELEVAGVWSSSRYSRAMRASDRE